MRPKAGGICRRAASSRATTAVTTAASRFGFRLSGKSSCGILAVAFSAILLLVSGCGDDGVISRFMLKREGGVAGHAIMYIKGACKDEQAPYPQLRRCRVAATQLSDPEHGAGVSVGRWFRNVNWVAIPGYELFYQGNLKFGQRLTQAHFEETVRDAIENGVYKGVEFHDYPSANSVGASRILS